MSWTPEYVWWANETNNSSVNTEASTLVEAMNEQIENMWNVDPSDTQRFKLYNSLITTRDQLLAMQNKSPAISQACTQQLNDLKQENIQYDVKWSEEKRKFVKAKIKAEFWSRINHWLDLSVIRFC